MQLEAQRKGEGGARVAGECPGSSLAELSGSSPDPQPVKIVAAFDVLRNLGFQFKKLNALRLARIGQQAGEDQLDCRGVGSAIGSQRAIPGAEQLCML